MSRIQFWLTAFVLIAAPIMIATERVEYEQSAQNVQNVNKENSND